MVGGGGRILDLSVYVEEKYHVLTHTWYTIMYRSTFRLVFRSDQTINIAVVEVACFCISFEGVLGKILSILRQNMHILVHKFLMISY